MLILLDPAHGHNTPGKRSPDGQLLGYAYTRDLARRIVSILKSLGYDSELLVPEDDDIPLSERVRRINAAGNGSKWMNATGWSCYTCKGQTESDRLADCLYKAAEQILKPIIATRQYIRS